MFDFSRTFRGVNTDFFFNFSDIFLISPTSDPSDFLLNRAVRAVCSRCMVFIFLMFLLFVQSPHRGCAGGRIGTRFLRPSPLKGVNPAGTPGYRNGTESFFGLKGHPSVVRDVKIHNQPVLRMRRK